MPLDLRADLYEACRQIFPRHPDYATLPVEVGFGWSSLSRCPFDRHSGPFGAGIFELSVHSIDHSFLEPYLSLLRLIGVALDDHLVVANENRHGPWMLASAFPQQHQRQLQAVGCGSLDGSPKSQRPMN